MTKSTKRGVVETDFQARALTGFLKAGHTNPQAFLLIDVPPNGTAKGLGCKRDGHGCSIVEIVTYADSEQSKKLRNLRINLNLGLRAAALRLGLSVLDLSALECGRKTTLSWEEIFKTLQENV